ncbi:MULTISPECIES: DUF1176 domain-containing protein [Pseudomonas]|uniref:DUF1176 domain-containing protein n=1 Tax=Pseudomonas TaxID=286 RepID=UPI001EFFC985|nr:MULTISPECIES: DUF1176 domain-containing protein [Pseudomonas]MCG8293862.1 DUF1176 domain-containing protein [Pseudomonas entomophila]
MRRATRWNWLAVALLPGLVMAAPEPVPLYREIKDWVVGCDNTRFCTAVLADAAQGMRVSIRVQRAAGAEGALHLTLGGSAKWVADPLLDGQPLMAAWRKTRNYAATTLQLDDADAYAALRQMRDAQRLEEDTEGMARVGSLQGLSAALLLIDSVQGRIGHPSALVRPGDAPDEALPPAPEAAALPPFVAPSPLNDEERAGITAVVMAKAGAENQLKNEYDVPPALEVHALDAAYALALLSYNCNDANCQYALYQVSRAAPHTLAPLAFEAPASPLLNTPMRDEIGFFAAEGRLYGMAKDDYQGSCGVEEYWRFDGQRMRLTHLARMDRCVWLGPDDWPVLWRNEG